MTDGVTTTTEYLTPRQAAPVAGVSAATIRNWLKAGILPGRKTLSGQFRVTRADAEAAARMKPAAETDEAA